MRSGCPLLDRSLHTFIFSCGWPFKAHAHSPLKGQPLSKAGRKAGFQVFGRHVHPSRMQSFKLEFLRVFERHQGGGWGWRGSLIGLTSVQTCSHYPSPSQFQAPEEWAANQAQPPSQGRFNPCRLHTPASADLTERISLMERDRPLPL